MGLDNNRRALKKHRHERRRLTVRKKLQYLKLVAERRTRERIKRQRVGNDAEEF